MASQAQPNLLPPSSAEAQQPRPTSPQGLHEIQLRYKLAPSTFKTLCTIQSHPARPDILKKACFATEFRSFPIKRGETAFFRAINDCTGIPYPIPENISQPWHKVFLLVQLNMSRAPWPNKLTGPARKELNQDLRRMYSALDSVLRCLVDILGERGDGKGVRTALDVLRSVKANVWEGSENELLQVEGIGAVKKERLAKAGIKSIRKLAKLEFYHIERLLSRNPPFGQTMLHQLAGFPVLTLDFEIVGQYTPTAESSGESIQSCPEQHIGRSLWIARAVVGFTNEDTPNWNSHTPWLTLVVEGKDGRLVWFWRGSAKRLVGSKEMIIGLAAEKGEELKIVLACEEIVGTMIQMNVAVSE
ncbi:hypothetical protein N0V84_001418 [Fusarium piperis]|uniref:SEC63 domain-containing protein n=1 Tax=Fusarium piperis TaxID=1435070 RepID=A0A9W8WL96_9HYPO|nr:hypothetical protein N0V84_001418 [Fusarium piperis]